MLHKPQKLLTHIKTVTEKIRNIEQYKKKLGTTVRELTTYKATKHKPKNKIKIRKILKLSEKN